MRRPIDIQPAVVFLLGVTKKVVVPQEGDLWEEHNERLTQLSCIYREENFSSSPAVFLKAIALGLLDESYAVKSQAVMPLKKASRPPRCSNDPFAMIDKRPAKLTLLDLPADHQVLLGRGDPRLGMLALFIAYVSNDDTRRIACFCVGLGIFRVALEAHTPNQIEGRLTAQAKFSHGVFREPEAVVMKPHKLLKQAVIPQDSKLLYFTTVVHTDVQSCITEYKTKQSPGMFLVVGRRRSRYASGCRRALALKKALDAIKTAHDKRPKLFFIHTINALIKAFSLECNYDDKGFERFLLEKLNFAFLRSISRMNPGFKKTLDAYFLCQASADSPKGRGDAAAILVEGLRQFVKLKPDHLPAAGAGDRRERRASRA